jgi:3',5'-cyclic AMP phosphodiesterase CpdA
MFKFLSLLLALAAFSCSPRTARIVLLPDTQTYAEKFPEVLDSQINWILREQKNIDWVLQQGDLTQNNNDKEWKVIQAAFQQLDGKVPYVLAAGNHDMGSGPGKFADVRNTSLYNQYFPIEKMQKLKGFGGTFEPGKIENAWYQFETGGTKWLVLTLEFGPRDKVLDWASGVIRNHPERLVILNTHSYMYSDSTRQGVGDSWRPQNYGVGKDSADEAVNDGEMIWEKLIKKFPNTRFVFSGHILRSGVGTLVSFNEAGNPVYQFLANYQEGVKGSIKGGNGWLRIVDLDFRKKRIYVRTYSPYINEWMKDPAHEFTIRHALFKTSAK